MTDLPKFHRFAPMVPVTDIDRSVDFYEQALGMTKVFENGDPVGFVVLDRAGVELHLTLAPRHWASTDNVCHLLVDDAAPLYEHLEAAGVRIVKGMRDADYRMRTFVFADPDGNRIDVGSYLDE